MTSPFFLHIWLSGIGSVTKSPSFCTCPTKWGISTKWLPLVRSHVDVELTPQHWFFRYWKTLWFNCYLGVISIPHWVSNPFFTFHQMFSWSTSCNGHLLSTRVSHCCIPFVFTFSLNCRLCKFYVIIGLVVSLTMSGRIVSSETW